MAKVGVFISHMHEDRDIALCLERLIDDSLLRAIRIFNSSNQTSITPGKPWRDEIIKEIQKCNTLLVIATPDSVHRPWVNFESGGAWASGKTVIPCCAKGMNPEALPTPFNHLQAINLDSTDGLRFLIKHLATQADLSFPSNFDFDLSCEEIKKSWSSKIDKQATFKWSSDHPNNPVIPLELPSIYLTALLAILQNHLKRTESKTVERFNQLRNDWKNSGLELMEYIQTLHDIDKVVLIGPLLMKAYFVDKLDEYGILNPGVAKRAGMNSIKEQFIDPMNRKYNVPSQKFDISDEED